MRKKKLGVPIPRIGPPPITFDAREIGFTLETSEETQRELRELRAESARALHKARDFLMD